MRQEAGKAASAVLLYFLKPYCTSSWGAYQQSTCCCAECSRKTKCHLHGDDIVVHGSRRSDNTEVGAANLVNTTLGREGFFAAAVSGRKSQQLPCGGPRALRNQIPLRIPSRHSKRQQVPRAIYTHGHHAALHLRRQSHKSVPFICSTSNKSLAWLPFIRKQALSITDH